MAPTQTGVLPQGRSWSRTQCDAQRRKERGRDHRIPAEYGSERHIAAQAVHQLKVQAMTRVRGFVGVEPTEYKREVAEVTHAERWDGVGGALQRERRCALPPGGGDGGR